MNNTWLDSLCWVNESIASRASETLMASQRRPLAGARLATRCPRCRVMNYGSPFSALFCRALNAITHARLIFEHVAAEHPSSDGMWTWLQSAPEHADAVPCATTPVKADLSGALMHVWTNSWMNIWSWWKLCGAAVSCLNRCLFLSTIVGVTHSQRDQVKVPAWNACLPCGKRRKRRRRETLTRKWPPCCAVTVYLSAALMHLFFLFYFVFSHTVGSFVTASMSFHHN